MAYVLKITKATDDVTDVTVEEKDLLFTSENNTGKIFIDRTDTVSNGATLNIAHGLSYVPLFICYGKDGSNNWQPLLNGSIGHAEAINIDVAVDATNIIIANNDGGSRDVRTMVFIDRAV